MMAHCDCRGCGKPKLGHPKQCLTHCSSCQNPYERCPCPLDSLRPSQQASRVLWRADCRQALLAFEAQPRTAQQDREFKKAKNRLAIVLEGAAEEGQPLQGDPELAPLLQLSFAVVLA